MRPHGVPDLGRDSTSITAGFLQRLPGRAALKVLSETRLPRSPPSATWETPSTQNRTRRAPGCRGPTCTRCLALLPHFWSMRAGTQAWRHSWALPAHLLTPTYRLTCAHLCSHRRAHVLCRAHLPTLCTGTGLCPGLIHPRTPPGAQSPALATWTPGLACKDGCLVVAKGTRHRGRTLCATRGSTWGRRPSNICALGREMACRWGLRGSEGHGPSWAWPPAASLACRWLLAGRWGQGRPTAAQAPGGRRPGDHGLSSMVLTTQQMQDEGGVALWDPRTRGAPSLAWAGLCVPVPPASAAGGSSAGAFPPPRDPSS